MKHSEEMWWNQTSMTEFILLGFGNVSHLRGMLFSMILLMYLMTIVGNIFIIMIIMVDCALQSPMYFFLKNLSFIEICFTLDTVPKMLVDLLAEDKSISFTGCALQMYFFFSFGCAECFILAAMAYDCHTAICNPLHYSTIMNQRFCCKVVGAIWITGAFISLLQTVWIFNMPFCGPNKVNHFFCDAPALLQLVCSDTYLYEMQIMASTLLVCLFPLTLILVSYIRIITTILRIPSSEGRRKAFSTCSSHLTVVTLFYGSGSLVYLWPKSSYSPDIKKLLSLFYTVITPMLNPIIYSLRNNEVKGALKRALGRKLISQKI
ncbi:olfactory receptor 10A7-like [Alligator mississippiensis]|uniref:olfactory receptor 10A7-like n=1 Tax=Alligator mississippiensis TaxID=8496 RepID=UPI000711D724|nr:olfactory receptor 10A7-like [Alligator mississippiensis]